MKLINSSQESIMMIDMMATYQLPIRLPGYAVLLS